MPPKMSGPAYRSGGATVSASCAVSGPRAGGIVTVWLIRFVAMTDATASVLTAVAPGRDMVRPTRAERAFDTPLQSETDSEPLLSRREQVRSVVYASYDDEPPTGRVIASPTRMTSNEELTDRLDEVMGRLCVEFERLLDSDTVACIVQKRSRGPRYRTRASAA